MAGSKDCRIDSQSSSYPGASEVEAGIFPNGMAPLLDVPPRTSWFMYNQSIVKRRHHDSSAVASKGIAIYVLA